MIHLLSKNKISDRIVHFAPRDHLLLTLEIVHFSLERLLSPQILFRIVCFDTHESSAFDRSRTVLNVNESARPKTLKVDDPDIKNGRFKRLNVDVLKV